MRAPKGDALGASQQPSSSLVARALRHIDPLLGQGTQLATCLEHLSIRDCVTVDLSIWNCVWVHYQGLALH